MPNTQSKSKIINQKSKKSILTATGLIIFILLLVVVDLTPIGGNIRFYSKWKECGHKPYEIDSSGLFGFSVPFYRPSSTLEPIRFGTPIYFCTPLEAEKAGYSATKDQYTFPELEKLKRSQ